MEALSLASELARRRRSLFVGRESEKAAWADILAEAVPRFHLLYVHGPGGCGKTALLRCFRDLAEGAGLRAAFLGGADIVPEPERFAAAVQARFAEGAAARGRADTEPRRLLLIDAYERLRPNLDEWLREAFLPQLPETAVVVIADRRPPGLAWRRDPGWQGALTSLRLDNLSEADARAYLRRRQIPPAREEEILSFALGHPLALALAADAVLQAPEVPFRPERAPEVVGSLLREMVERVSLPEQRQALEAAALVRHLDEPLLSALVERPDARDLFEWLGTLSVVQVGRHGLRLHETVQALLCAESRWRNGPRHAELVARAREHYTRRLRAAEGEDQQRLLADYLFLHRDGPAGRPYQAITAPGVAGLVVRRAEGPEAAVLQQWIARHEGPESAGLAAAWMQAQPTGVLALVDASGCLHGGAVLVDPATSPPGPPDPCLAVVPVGSGPVVLVRHWLGAGGEQGVSPAQGALFVAFLQHYLAVPDLRFSVIVCRDAAFWEPLMRGGGFQPVRDGRFALAGRTYGVFARDWQSLSPLAWLQLLGSEMRFAALAARPSAEPTPSAGPQGAGLDGEAFASAVRHALRHVREPDVLAGNPLLTVPAAVGGLPPQAPEPARIHALQEILRAAVEGLASSPRRAKLHRALLATYWGTASTQEEVAEALDVPFSTYRGHLKAGIELVVEALRRQAAAPGGLLPGGDPAETRYAKGSASAGAPGVPDPR